MVLSLEMDIVWGKDSGQHVRDKVRDFMVRLAARIHALGLEHPQYLGHGRHAGGLPAYTGRMRNAWTIIRADESAAVVGVSTGYAGALVRGDPDPGARLEDVGLWVRRKHIDVPPAAVWRKVRHRGPYPNPFHERIAGKLRDEIPAIIQEVRADGL